MKNKHRDILSDRINDEQWNQTK